jgi:hypothetical protein
MISSVMTEFFADSDFLAYMVTRPLSHIKHNWELTWNSADMQYVPEDDSYADLLNRLIDELHLLPIPKSYHGNEDELALYLRDKLGWPIKKVGVRWEGADYDSILEQGGFFDIDQSHLLTAAAGRIHIARRYGQMHFDEMEKAHRRILGAVIAIILYHRSS